MPTLKEDMTISTNIDFSVYCGICGSGCCNDTVVDDRRNHVTITCSNCQKTIDDLNAKIDDLEERINRGNGAI